MAFLRKKGKYYQLVHGVRDPDTKKVKQKVVKHYGKDKPSEEQVNMDKENLKDLIQQLGVEGKTNLKKMDDKDKEQLGTTFDINSKITKATINSIIGTVWRNKFTHKIVCITSWELMESGQYVLFNSLDKDDPEVTWVSSRHTWKDQMDKWYRIDNIPENEQLEGFRKRIGYCHEELNIKRKSYNYYLTLPKEQRTDRYTSNLGLRKMALDWAEKDYNDAVSDCNDFKKDFIKEKPETSQKAFSEYPRVHFAHFPPNRVGKRLKANCGQQVRRVSCRDDTRTQPDVNCKNCLKVMPIELLTNAQKEYMKDYWAQHNTLQDKRSRIDAISMDVQQ